MLRRYTKQAVGVIILLLIFGMAAGVQLQKGKVQELWRDFERALRQDDRQGAAQLLSADSLSRHYVDSWATICQAEGIELSGLSLDWILPWQAQQVTGRIALSWGEGQQREYPLRLSRGDLGWRIEALPELYASPAALLYPEDEAMFLQLGDMEMEEFALPWYDEPRLGFALCERDELLIWQEADTRVEAKVVSYDDEELWGTDSSYALASRLTIYQRRLGRPCRSLDSLSPGMSDLQLCFWQGKVVGALLASDWQPQRIRVLLHDGRQSSLIHTRVTIYEAEGTRYQDLQGEWQLVDTGLLQLDREGEELLLRDAEGRVLLRTSEAVNLSRENETLQLRWPGGIDRGYRGQLEARMQEHGFILINELPVEEYLRGVVGNEMPPTFGSDALALQAIIARGYALRSILQPSSWHIYGAHLDDSSASQVYLLNGGEQSGCDAAVARTAGEVLFYDDMPARTFFFSTSGGFTAAPEEAWLSQPRLRGHTIPYLRALAQGYGLPQLNSEAAVLDFYRRSDWAVADRDSPWFRWQLSLSKSELGRLLSANILELAPLAADLIHVADLAEGADDRAVATLPEDWLGELQQIEAVQRGANGQLICLGITGSKARCLVHGELLIRRLFAPTEEIQPRYLLHNGGERIADEMPSAFVAWQESGDGEAYAFYGGGFGHGVGLSQYGACGLLENEWSLERILDHYYPGTELKDWQDWWGS